MAALSSNQFRAVLYILMNIGSGTCIVFANKLVLSVYQFHFVYALTLIHTVTTMVGMWMFASVGMFQQKGLRAMQILPLAAAFVGYIVFWNLSLQLNSVGFYQLSKILIAPAIILIEAVWFKKVPTRMELAAVALLCIGVTLATVSDSEIAANLPGLLMSGLAIWTTSIYQIWAGSKQKEYQVSSMQLMDNYCPYAAGLLCFLVPVFEPLGIDTPLVKQHTVTLFSFPYTPIIVGAIALTAVLGLLVSLSTFLVIGATSSLTYNVVSHLTTQATLLSFPYTPVIIRVINLTAVPGVLVSLSALHVIEALMGLTYHAMGHLKTVIILAGGFVLFDEKMPAKKLGGVLIALVGIIWYSGLKMQKASAPPTAPGKGPAKSVEAEPLVMKDKPKQAVI